MTRPVRLILGLGLTLAACDYYALEGLSLVAPMGSIVVGDTTSLSVVNMGGAVRPATGVSWSSSDESVATIDVNGTVLGIGPGTTQIQAEADDYELRVPLLVLELAGPFQTVVVGVDHACGLDEAGDSWCWGRNEFGQLGTSDPPDACPAPFFGGSVPCAVGAVRVSAEPFVDLVGGHYHTCGLTAAGRAYCWGSNENGQLGDGTTASGPVPLPVAGDHRFRSLAASERRTCGVRENDDALLCWGLGPFPIDDGEAASLTEPARVAGALTFSSVAVGRVTCGVSTEGDTWCWGAADRGALGVPAEALTCDADPCMVPQRVADAPAFVEVVVGTAFACGLSAEGAAWCWGANEIGQLGDGTRVDRSTPAPVQGDPVFDALEADYDAACGLSSGGPLLCWGQIEAGFGRGDAPAQGDFPVEVAPEVDAMHTSIGFSTQCTVDTSGVARCWGQSGWGILGHGLEPGPEVLFPTRVVRHPDYASPRLGSD